MVETFAKALACCFVFVAAIAAANAAEEGDRTNLVTYQLPKGPSNTINDLAVDETGVVWTMANGRLFYLRAGQFESGQPHLHSGSYLDQLYGDFRRGVYATQKGSKDHEGVLYRLRAGTCEKWTNFYYDIAHRPPCIYIAKDGRIFNWGQRFVSVYDGQEWHKTEVSFSGQGINPPVICDLGKNVYLYSPASQKICVADEACRLSIKEAPAWVRDLQQATDGLWRPTIYRHAWGKLVLLVGSNSAQLVAFDVETLDRVNFPVATNEARAHRLTLCSGFERSKDAFWVSVRERHEPGYAFYELRRDRLERVPGLDNLPWDNIRCMTDPDAIVVTQNGAVALGLAKGGAVVSHKEGVEHLDWRNGFSSGVRHLAESPDGAVWLPEDADKGEVASLRVGNLPAEEVAEIEDWEEWPLTAGSRVWAIGHDEIAAFRRDRPGKLSRWKSGKWTHRDVPFDTSYIYRAVADDRGHLLVHQAGNGVGYYDIGPNAIESHASVRDLLASAVRHGATHFDYRGSSSIDALTTRTGQLWYVDNANRKAWLYYDGAWTSHTIPRGIAAINELSSGDVMITTFDHKSFRYEAGQIVEVNRSPRFAKAVMLGDRGFWVGDGKPAMKLKAKSYPVIRDARGMRLYFDFANFERALAADASPLATRAGATLPQYSERILPATTSGSWLYRNQGASGPYRIWANRMWELDLELTPLGASYAEEILETSNGDLWMLKGIGSDTHLFHLKQSALSIELTPPESVGRELSIEFAVEPERLVEGIRLLTEVDGHMQSELSTNERVAHFRFPASGGYECRLRGLRLGGMVRNCPQFTVEATVELPDTIWEGPAEKTTVTTLEWKPQVRKVPSRESANPQVYWSCDGSPWHELIDGEPLVMSEFEQGEHEYQFRTEEEGFWKDPTPITVVVDYQPDYERIVDEYSKMLLSPEKADRDIAFARLRSLGNDIAPLLQQKINEAEEAVKLLPELIRLQDRIGRDTRADDASP